MTPDPDMRDLDSALAWLERHWTGHAAPMRLHGAGVEWDGPGFIEGPKQPGGKTFDPGGGSRLGAPRLADGFRAYLAQRPGDVVTAKVTEDCYHPRLVGNNVTACPDCDGAGVKHAERARFRDPMWRALDRLSTERARPGQAGWAHVIMALVVSDYRPEIAARLIGAAVIAGDITWNRRDFWEPMFVLAIRKLHRHYQVTPVARPNWIEKSDAQRAAESAA